VESYRDSIAEFEGRCRRLAERKEMVLTYVRKEHYRGSIIEHKVDVGDLHIVRYGYRGSNMNDEDTRATMWEDVYLYLVRK